MEWEINWEYYLYAFLDVWFKYGFELTWLGIGILWLWWMDFINFQRPLDSGYFSIHTKGSKRDAWHDGKKLAIFSFGIAAIGEKELIFIVDNAYIQLAIIAFVTVLFYKALKWVYKLFN